MILSVIRGNRLELPWLDGRVVELDRALACRPPKNPFIYVALKPHMNGGPASMKPESEIVRRKCSCDPTC